MELIDYILEPAIPFGIVVYIFWRIFRDEVKDAFSGGDE
jgi:hypothetical protein